MSGIYGVLNRHKEAVKTSILEAMAEGNVYWNPDEKKLSHEGHVVLGHSMLWNTPESKYEHLPLQEDAYILTMDARLDNREALMLELDLPDVPLAQMGDSAFILAAYKKWGETCPEQLLGDFAFAIWDKQKQSLFCARDHIGIKQFYYHLSDALFVFANDLKGLVAHPDIKQDIDDKAVANYMIYKQLNSKTRTFFSAIKKLEAGHSMCVKADSISTTCYWRLEDAPKVTLPNIDAYVKALRALLEEAVYCRMRTAYPLTSHLSGGVDSSAIAVIVARKLKEKGEKLLAFNWIHEPDSNQEQEEIEWAYSQRIAKAEGIEHHYVALSAENIERFMQQRDVRYGESASFWYEYPIRKKVHSHGSRTLLSGWGGDEFASYSGKAYFSDLFLKLKWGKLYKALNCHPKNKGLRKLKNWASIVYTKIVLRLVPKTLYCKMPGNDCFNDDFSYVSTRFASTLKKEQKKPRILTMQAKPTIKGHMLAYWQYGHLHCRVESWAAAARTHALEYAYPLLDKRIVEFMYGVPPECFVVDGKYRYIFRKAVEDLLSKEILWDTHKYQELNRVNRLLEMQTSWMKSLAKKKLQNGLTSKYIDTEKLHDISALEAFDLEKNMDRVYILHAINGEIYLALLFDA